MYIFVEPVTATTSNESSAGPSNENVSEIPNENAILDRPTHEPSDTVPMETDNSNDNLNFAENTIESQNDSTNENESEKLNTNEEFDLGDWMGKSMSSEQKSQMLKHCWVPPESYNFSADSSDPKRKFIHSWLQTYAPWLAYSKKLKGALCLHCVLFHQTVVKGVFGAFVVKPFSKFKDLHSACQNHATSKWHQASMKAAKSFVEDNPVDVQMITGHDKLIEENKKILASVISSVIFCGRTDSPLRGKEANTGRVF